MEIVHEQSGAAPQSGLRAFDPGVSVAEALNRRLVHAGLIAEDSDWERLGGGRTNTVFKVRHGEDQRVCKISRPDRATPLFPNRPDHEFRAMRAMSRHGLAPDVIGALRHGPAHCLVYHFVDGPPLGACNPDSARLLRRVHRNAPSGALLRIRPPLENLLVRSFPRLMDRLHFTASVKRAVWKAVDAARALRFGKLIHGDPVLANIVAAQIGSMLIDWQCAALGDPSTDIAIAVSPSMATLYQGRSLSPAETSEFLDAYGCAKTVARYREIAPALHMQILAHCAWKAARGEQDYAEALPLEADLLATWR